MPSDGPVQKELCTIKGKHDFHEEKVLATRYDKSYSRAGSQIVVKTHVGQGWLRSMRDETDSWCVCVCVCLGSG